MLHALLPESRVNLGTTLFIQIMDFLPWKRFHRIGARRDGDRYARRLSCAERFRVMAFAQRSYRESLRDIEGALRSGTAPTDVPTRPTVDRLNSGQHPVNIGRLGAPRGKRQNRRFASWATNLALRKICPAIGVQVRTNGRP